MKASGETIPTSVIGVLKKKEPMGVRANAVPEQV
jgi:hypothetical protein